MKSLSGESSKQVAHESKIGNPATDSSPVLLLPRVAVWPSCRGRCHFSTKHSKTFSSQVEGPSTRSEETEDMKGKSLHCQGGLLPTYSPHGPSTRHGTLTD